MSRYQTGKILMEKFLRRSFYDAVLELYETDLGTRIISVSLEGNLSLVINKDERFIIKLNEIAQRADDREETISRYVVKKEEILSNPVEPASNQGKEVNNLDPVIKENEKFAHMESVESGKMEMAYDNKNKYLEAAEDKLNENKTESDSFDKSSEGESESDEDGDSEIAMSFQPHSMLPFDAHPHNPHKIELDNSADDINFLPVGEIDGLRRKLDFIKDHDHGDILGKKSPRKRRKTASSTDGDDDGIKVEEKSGSSVSNVDDGVTGGLQLLPHTASAPIIVEEDENSFSSGMTESQLAQLAFFQMRDSNVGVFRQQDLEELARQQQQWQMVAYQRSIMEKSYLQQQMQQYQRDTERLRWEYVTQRELQSRDYTPHPEETEKIYRQTQAQTAATEAAMLAAAALEQAKKCAREGGDEVSIGGDKVSTQYLRMFAEEHVTQVDADYEEGELRPDSHSCVLCGAKSMTLDLLMRHMEKHRTAFERSCSVCQSGTLTGNMLILHMEASHGSENFSLPSTAPAPSTSSSTSQSITDFSQSFPSSLQTTYSNQSQEESTGMKLPQQPHSPKHTALKVQEPDEGASSSHVKSESEESFDYSLSATAQRPDSEMTSLPQENFLGIPAQFYPLIGCQVCGEKFALSEALDQHVESQHKDAECSYTCKPCCLTFKTHIEYSKHMTRHEATSANLKCSHCLKSFKSVKQLRLHYVAAHGCCHFCEYCRAGFPDAVSLQLHENLHTLDPEKLTYRCDICNKAFYTQSQCSAHKRTHKDEKAHACEVCGSAFFKRGDLTKHVRTVHSPSRLFSCKFCGKKGTRMDNMRSHVKSHHKNMTRDQIINMIEVIE